MSFSPIQVRRLRARLPQKHVRERQVEGKTLHYLEGWHIVAEANRIFGFDGWDRQTLSSECVWRHPVETGFAASYLVRVRVRVRAGEGMIVREGIGSGEAIASTPGQAHERAAKAAETDATKRALSTFGNAFGLCLYAGKPESCSTQPAAASEIKLAGTPTSAQELKEKLQPTGRRVDKSVLAFSEPKRVRDPDHLKRVAAEPCLVCGRRPSQAHHLRFAQPRALGRKVSDEFVVPLCALHHSELHLRGDERHFWGDRRVDPFPIARELWQASVRGAPSDNSGPYTATDNPDVGSGNRTGKQYLTD